MLGSIEKFKPNERIGRSEVDWRDILRWWLDLHGTIETPSLKQVGNWHSYVKICFQYRFNWGFSNFISLAFDEAFGGQLGISTIDDWRATGLPWVVIWMKDLIIWGTLDPVAAYILAKELAVTRPEAELLAQQYYHEADSDEANELLNPTHIREWTNRQFQRISEENESRPPREIIVDLLRDFSEAPRRKWRVLPVIANEKILWLDPAGFPLAEGQRDKEWSKDWLYKWDFVLDHVNGIVSSSQYL